jgi:hypothetical protein
VGRSEAEIPCILWDSRGKTVNSSHEPESERREAGGEPQFASRPSPLAITCPFCGGTDVELFSLFGSQLLTSEYYCRNCRTVFENVKG